MADVMHAAFLARVKAYGEMLDGIERFLDGVSKQLMQQEGEQHGV